MAYKVIILYQLYMPSYFLGTFTEYPYEDRKATYYSELPDCLSAGGSDFVCFVLCCFYYYYHYNNNYYPYGGLSCHITNLYIRILFRPRLPEVGFSGF